MAVGNSVAVGDAVGTPVAVGDGVAGATSVPDGVGVAEGSFTTGEDVAVAVSTGVGGIVGVSVGESVGVDVTVSVGGGVVSTTSSAKRSALVVGPSPLTSVSGHELRSKIAVTTALRSRPSTTPSQFASPSSALAICGRAAKANALRRANRRRRSRTRAPRLTFLIAVSSRGSSSWFDRPRSHRSRVAVV